jgi:GAF domain-containing protein/HAMP domain-containing protein
MLALIGLTTRRVLRPVGMLADTALAISQGDLTRPVPVESEDELGVLAHAFNSMTEQLRSLTTSLEERVAARTQRLELVAALGEHLSGVLNLEELLGVAIKEIKDNFGYYHVQVYLFDEPRENLLLVDGVGEAGAEIKAQGHRIPLSTKRNLITRAANTAQVVKVDDVREEEDWLPNPLLPDTVSEMVVPIIIEGQVAGILDVQENRVAGLDESDASLLRSVANQIAVAINNSRLFQETQSALAEVETLNRQLTRDMWQDIHRKADTTGYVFTKSGTSPAPQEWMPAMTEAIHRKNLTYNHNGSEAPASQLVDSLAIPLTLRGEIIGVIGVERSTPDENNHASRTWSEDELVTVQTIAEQIALALDSARLSRETKQAAWRDRIVSEATAKVWASAELEEVMKTAVAQLGDKLRASEVVIRLGSDFDALQPNA